MPVSFASVVGEDLNRSWDEDANLTSSVSEGIPSLVSNGTISFSFSDTLVLAYPDAFQNTIQYKITFDTPNDGITHTYSWVLNLDIPADAPDNPFEPFYMYPIKLQWWNGAWYTAYQSNPAGSGTTTAPWNHADNGAALAYPIPPNRAVIFTIPIYMLTYTYYINQSVPFNGNFIMYSSAYIPNDARMVLEFN
jgi:hypothetical protein